MLLDDAEDDFACFRMNERKHFGAYGAEPIVNDVVEVLCSLRDDGDFSVGQDETKELAADVMIKAGAASRIGTFRNHFALSWTGMRKF
jgi:hypothetical protein